MTWEDYKNRKLPFDVITVEKIKTDIDCPKCGEKIWKRQDIVLTSYPAKYQYECDCEWVGYDYK